MRANLHWFYDRRFACATPPRRRSALGGPAAQEERAMLFHGVEVLAALVSAALFVYLGYALLRPEKF
jgi:K+-transporting ATPase KdpF subunit